MNKNFKKFLSVLLSVVVLFVSVPSTCFEGVDLSGFFSFKANAVDEYISDIYTYTFKNGRATIVACDPDASGEVVIPQYLGGYLVNCIGEYAFDNCTQITSVSLPESITTISAHAFYNCYNLLNVSISYGVTDIGVQAFYHCTGITEIALPESLTNIGSYAFAHCYQLESINIPNSVLSLGEFAFENCHNMKEIYIGEGITEIKEHTFALCGELTKVSGGRNVEIIGENAFAEDVALVSIEFGDKVVTISDYAFYDCYALSDWSFPDSLRTIGAYSFSYTSLKSALLKEGLSSLRKSAFANCYNLKTVAIPGSIISVAQNVFENCKLLEELIFGIGIQQIESKAFYMCRSLKKVTLPDSLLSIGSNAFYGCEILEDVEIGEQLNSIGDYAFSFCDSISAFLVDENNANYADIDGVLLNKDKSTLIVYPKGNKRTHYTIPSTVKRIQTKAFYGSNNLSSVSISENVEIIGNSAFAYCAKLTSINIFSKDVKIERYAFDQTGYYKAEDNWDNGVLYLDGYLLSAKKFIDESCTIKEGTISIADYAFYDNELTEVIIPESVENIGEGAFYYCVFLSDITIGENVKNIGENAFYRTDYYDNDDKWNDNELYIDKYLIIADKTVSGLYEVQNGTTVIADEAFNNCTNISGIVLPEFFKNFSKNALASNQNITVYTYEDSQAVDYCASNDIEYKFLALEGIEIDVSNAKIEYVVGDVLETDGVVIYALLGNNIKREVDLSEVAFSKVEMKRPVKYRVTVTYRDYNTFYNISVNEPELESIEILSLPNKLIYSAGECLETEGLSLTVYYQNGTKEEVYSGFEISGNTELQGESTIKVSYTEKGKTVYTTYTITVIENTSPIISAEQMSATIGDVIRVPISISNNNGFMGFGINIEYDISAFEPLKVIGGENLVNGSLNDSIGGTIKNGLLKIVYSGDENINFDGVMFYVDFYVKEDCIADNYELAISYSQGDTFDEAWKDVKFNCRNFIITVYLQAGGLPHFYANDITVASAQRFTVPIMLKNNSGISEFTLQLIYDATQMNFESVIIGEALNGYVIESKEDENNGLINLSWKGTGLNDGVIAYVVFVASGNASDTLKVEMLCTDCDAENVSSEGFNIYIESLSLLTNPLIYSDVVYAIPGELVEVPVYIKNNSGLMGFGIEVAYDATLLTPVSVERGTVTNCGLLADSIETSDGRFKIIWNHSEDVVNNGLLLTLQFRVSSEVDVNSLLLSFNCITQDTYNETWQNVELTAINANVLIDTMVIESPEKSICVGKALQLSAAYNHLQKECDVVWKSENESVATVDDNGCVTAVSAGFVNISATTIDGKYSSNLNLKVSPLAAKKGSRVVIDYSDCFVYGLTCGLNALDDYVYSSDELFIINLQLNGTHVGTGSLIEIINSEGLFEKYTIIIFGDVNGDGWYDGEDAFLVNLIAKGMLDKDDVGEAIWTAADCNHDGVIDESDVDLLTGAGLKLNDVDQSKTAAELATNSDYIEYVMLIDQSAGMSVEPDGDNSQQGTTTPETNETVEPDEPATENNIDFEVIFTNILELFKKIFAFVFSLIIK